MTNRTRVLLLLALMVVPLCSRVAVSETPQPPLDRKYVLFGSSNLHLFFLLFLGSLLPLRRALRLLRFSNAIGRSAFGCQLFLRRPLAIGLLLVSPRGRSDSRLSFFRFPTGRFRDHVLHLLLESLLLRQHFLHLRRR